MQTARALKTTFSCSMAYPFATKSMSVSQSLRRLMQFGNSRSIRATIRQNSAATAAHRLTSRPNRAATCGMARRMNSCGTTYWTQGTSSTVRSSRRSVKINLERAWMDRYSAIRLLFSVTTKAAESSKESPSALPFQPEICAPEISWAWGRSSTRRHSSRS